MYMWMELGNNLICVGLCEGKSRAEHVYIMWMELGNNLICVGLCEGKSRAEHVYVDGAGQ